MTDKPFHPLPSAYHEFERFDHEDSYIGEVMEIPDYYHALSKETLTDHLEIFKSEVIELYKSFQHKTGTLSGTPNNGKGKTLYELFQILTDQLSSGVPATECMDTIGMEFFEDYPLTKSFPHAIMLLVCADLLKKHGLEYKAWPLLLEFKSLEQKLFEEALAQASENLSLIKKEAGSTSQARYVHLKYFFIELLSQKAPDEGWGTHGDTVRKLTSDVIKLHQQSPQHASKFRLVDKEIEEDSANKGRGFVETKLINWLKKDKEVREAFYANSSRPPNRPRQSQS